MSKTPLKLSVETLETHLKSLLAELVTLRKDVVAERIVKKELKVDLDEKTTSLDQMRHYNDKLQGIIDQQVIEIWEAKEQLLKLNASNEEKALMIKSLNEDMEGILEEKAQWQTPSEVSEEKTDESQEVEQTLTAQKDTIDSLQKEQQEKEEKLLKLQNENTALKEEVVRLKQELEASQVDEVGNQVNDLKAEVEKLRVQLEESEVEKELLQEELSQRSQ